MATQIESVELYLLRTTAISYNIIVSIYSADTDLTDPDAGDLLGSKSVSASTLPSGSPDWFTITFDSPITIPSTGFYGMSVTVDGGSGFQNARTRWYWATDYSAPSSPFAGDERFFRFTGGTWANVAGSYGAYRINYVGGSQGNKAETTQDINYYNFSSYIKQGVRTYLEVLPAPGKATNPTPANSGTEVDFSGLVLDWDTGADTDTFNVYMGPVGSLSLIATGIVPSTFTVNLSDVPKEQVIYWRIDSVNDEGTTTGDTWNFDARPAKVVTPSPTNAQSDITLDESPLSWEAG